MLRGVPGHGPSSRPRRACSNAALRSPVIACLHEPRSANGSEASASAGHQDVHRHGSAGSPGEFDLVLSSTLVMCDRASRRAWCRDSAQAMAVMVAVVDPAIDCAPEIACSSRPRMTSALRITRRSGRSDSGYWGCSCGPAGSRPGTGATRRAEPASRCPPRVRAQRSTTMTGFCALTRQLGGLAQRVRDRRAAATAAT